MTNKNLSKDFDLFAGLTHVDLGVPSAEVSKGAMLASNDFLSTVVGRQGSLPAMEFFTWANRQGLIFLSMATIKERAWGFAKGIREGSTVAAEQARAFHAFLAGFDPTRILKEDTWEMTCLLACGFNLPGIGDLYRASCRKETPRLRTDIVVALQAYAHEMPVISASRRLERLRARIPFPGVLTPTMATRRL